MARRNTGRPNPPTFYYHYSNPAAQDALVCETPEYPDSYDDEREEARTTYADYVVKDAKLAEQLSQMLYGRPDYGEQCWSQDLAKLEPDALREFVRVVFKQKHKPLHARVIHHFNVSTGANCSILEAIFTKEPADVVASKR
jgi:hypothetical protein